MILQPFVYQLRDALVAAEIATPEQGERFIAFAEAEEEARWNRRLDEMRNAPRWRWWERMGARKVQEGR